MNLENVNYDFFDSLSYDRCWAFNNQYSVMEMVILVNFRILFEYGL